jgi:hypothetical protein
MRKYKKDIVLDLVRSLKEAYERLPVIISKKEYSETYDLLEVCQQAAFSIGTAIEESESHAAEIIPELEAYCDDLYMIGRSLTDSGYDPDPVLKSIKRRLSFIETFVRDNIKVKYEIAFLPYSASMWDSMESVWSAAVNDPNCSCYVVPIPYYEKTANGDEMKYEGPLFPEYVPVVHYSNYSIPDRKPDIIYIHNPFDQYNRVTSVHPSYYSSELKKHTKMLVYIPYFVTGKCVPETFLNLPSYKYIDKIVVQSHSQLRYYRQHIPADKLIALGSPKVDKVISLSKQQKNYPEEWKSIIGNKRVIFYNTSLSGLLKYREKALDKMEYIFSIFKGRDKDVLLWRPHPLTKATLCSMAPELYKRYCEQEQRFINESIGIYDATSDVSTSIALSDAYIGEEGSSVVHLFGITGKPIFLLDMALTESSIHWQKNLVGGMDAYIENDYLWFIHCHYNALCKMNINTGKTEIVDLAPYEPINKERLYYGIVKINEKLYFAPHKAKELAVYDLSRKHFIGVAHKKHAKTSANQFAKIIHYKDYIFMIPIYYPALVRYDVKNNTYKYYHKFVDVLETYGKRPDQNAPYFMNAVYADNNLLLAASATSNLVVEFNMETENISVHRVGNDENNFFGMEYDGNDYWLIPNKSKAIVRWNRITGQTFEYSNFPEGFISGNNAFFSIIDCKDYMLAFPKHANMIVRIDKDTGIMSEYKLPLHYKEGERKEPYYSWPNNYYFVKKADDRNILALTAYDSSLLLIDTETQTCVSKKCIIEKRIAGIEFGPLGDNYPYCLKESSYADVEDFINNLEDKKFFNRDEQIRAYSSVFDNTDGSCGKKIHDFMVDNIVK